MTSGVLCLTRVFQSLFCTGAGRGSQLYLGVSVEEGIDLHCGENESSCKKVFFFGGAWVAQ